MLVSTPCPQCGGEIEFFDETEAVKCRYCGSLLQLVGSEGVRRYYLKPKTDRETITKSLLSGIYLKKRITIRSLNTRLIFYPYWWIKGMVFKWLIGKKTIPSKLKEIPNGWENVKELKTHLFDHTFPANGEVLFGPSNLGIRTQTMQVRAFNRKEMEAWGLPLKTTISHAQAIASAEKLKGSALKLKDVDIEMEKTRLIGERYSLIFLPIWVISFPSPQGESEVLIDGVSHSVITIPKKEKTLSISTLSQETLGFEPEDVSFIPFRCPICGWDLPFHPFNVIHLCTTCGRAWWEKGGSYQEVGYNVVKRKDDGNEPITHLPFWAFKVSLKTPTDTITTMDQFYLYFPVPRLMDKKREQKRRVTFYIPAFRIKDIPLVNKFSTYLTHNQPERQYSEKETLLKHAFGNVFLRVNEAKEMAEILLFSLIPTNSRKAKDFVSQAQIQFAQEHLEWYPFV
ncbi:MAG: hypothetical protein V2A69_03880, partial [Pseudomonadota bacterium]